MEIKEKVLNKLTDFRGWIESFYKKQGRKGLAYSVLISLLGYYFLHTVAKHQG